MDYIHSQAAVRDVAALDEPLPDPRFRFEGPGVPGGKFEGTFEEAANSGASMGLLLWVALSVTDIGQPMRANDAVTVTKLS